jgi:NADPH:quinone reductase-like Zn-dependent oxidoreductase
MKLEEVPVPEPKAGEVLIKVHAVSVNRTLDCVVRAGKYARRVSLPLTPGVDPSGVVTKLGSGVTDRKVGDRVTVQLRTSSDSGADSIRNLGVHAWGGHAEYVCALAGRTVSISPPPPWYRAMRQPRSRCCATGPSWRPANGCW